MREVPERGRPETRVKVFPDLPRSASSSALLGRSFLVLAQRKPEHLPLVRKHGEADHGQQCGKHIDISLLHGLPNRASTDAQRYLDGMFSYWATAVECPHAD